MSGCLLHESGRSFGCSNCDLVCARLSEPGWRNVAWLRSRVLELEARLALAERVVAAAREEAWRSRACEEAVNAWDGNQEANGVIARP